MSYTRVLFAATMTLITLISVEIQIALIASPYILIAVMSPLVTIATIAILLVPAFRPYVFDACALSGPLSLLGLFILIHTVGWAAYAGLLGALFTCSGVFIAACVMLCALAYFGGKGHRVIKYALAYRA